MLEITPIAFDILRFFPNFESSSYTLPKVTVTFSSASTQNSHFEVRADLSSFDKTL